MTETLFLTSDEVSSLATPEEYVNAVRDAYRQRGEGAPAKPRTTLPNKDPAGMLTGYMAILPDTGAMGGYMYAAGFEKGDAWFMLPIYDAKTGEPLALIDGASMNPFKTGAAGAVGVDALSREDAKTVGLIGSGSQARGQLRATVTVRDIETVWVYSPTEEHRKSFAREMTESLGIDVKAVGSSSEAVKGADIVITATTASEPVFDGDLLENGTHVTAMGQYNPEKREIDSETIRRSKYVPDLRERAFQDAGAFLQALEKGVITEDHIHAELGEVVAGEIEGRESSKDVTVFDSGGTAIETVASGYMLYEKARDEGLGRTVDIAPASEALTGR
ncbi:MAG: ornithine cyclodeaminase family protein [Halobacteria archaeon]|nr:ornithine cyclodeaminase family protein [Halobacteria archaeon]